MIRFKHGEDPLPFDSDPVTIDNDYCPEFVCSAIPKINQPGNQRKIFWIKVLSNILSMAESEISKNPVYSMFESQFLSASFCVNVMSAQPRDFNQQINCAFIGHNKPDSSFVTFIN